MKAPVEIAAASIGAAAYATCQQCRAARVIGVTARGLFLLSSPQRIIFVSVERYRSPLTINLDRSFDRLRPIEVGVTAQLSDTRLIFPSIEFSISLSEDMIWHCPPPVAEPRPRTEQRRTLCAIGEGVLARVGRDGLAAVLARLLDLPDTLLLSGEQSALLERLIEVRRAVQTDDAQQVIAGLMSILGQGRGLTPAGDDVVIGLLLMLNRWRADHNWAAVNRAVIEAAYRVTTTISANLIECAADGQGDERLITVADGIVAGSASIGEGVLGVLGWGSASGIDALVGIAVSVTVF